MEFYNLNVQLFYSFILDGFMSTNQYSSRNLNCIFTSRPLTVQQQKRFICHSEMTHTLCAQSAGSQEQVTMTNRDYHALLETHAYERYTAELLFAGTRPSGIWALFGSMSSETGPVAMAVWWEFGLEHAHVQMHAFACMITCVKWTKARWV